MVLESRNLIHEPEKGPFNPVLLVAKRAIGPLTVFTLKVDSFGFNDAENLLIGAVFTTLYFLCNLRMSPIS